jgi:hypothetical protein
VNDELERIRQEEVVAQLQSTIPASGKLMAWKIMRRAEDEGSMFISNALIYGVTTKKTNIDTTSNDTYK